MQAAPSADRVPRTASTISHPHHRIGARVACSWQFTCLLPLAGELWLYLLEGIPASPKSLVIGHLLSGNDRIVLMPSRQRQRSIPGAHDRISGDGRRRMLLGGAVRVCRCNDLFGQSPQAFSASVLASVPDR